MVTRLFLPEPGAASLRLSALSTALLDLGYRLTVLTSRAPMGLTIHEKPTTNARMRVRRFPVLRDRAGYVRGYLQYMSFDLPAFWRILLTPRVDVVVVEPPPTTGFIVRIACALRRIPYVYFAADIWSDAARSAGTPRLMIAAVRSMERWAMGGASRVLCVSQEFTDRLRMLGVSTPISVVGNGADLSRFTSEGEQKSLDGPYFLYAGTASEVHGAMIFLDAFTLVADRHPEARLVFLGHGSDWASLIEFARGLPAEVVRFVPRVAPEEAASWMRGAVATLASVVPGGYVRAFPTKIYSSVACGTPVVFTGVGPAHAFIERSELGVAVGYDAGAVAQAIIGFLENPFERTARAKIAEWATTNISLDAVGQRGASVIKEVVNATHS
jgi:glycosyltransferase involved in cell wall biosynthesis